MSMDPLVAVDGLKKHYPVRSGVLSRESGRLRAVDGVSFSIQEGEIFGLVGESGCGKSTAALSLLRLEEPTAGVVMFAGEDVLGFDAQELKRFRRRAQMIFQDPTSSFDPRQSIGDSVTEPLRVHGITSEDRCRDIATMLLDRVGLSPDDYYRYPHEFSGGQKQRIALARAMVLNPDFLIADEPVSGLDVSVQASVLSLLEEFKSSFDLSMLFISHDMAVIREICDRVGVMYLGEIVEIAPTDSLFGDPQHPYTRALLSSIPSVDPRDREWGIALGGEVPDPSSPPPGCRFHTRCPELIEPQEYELSPDEWRSVHDILVALRSGVISIQKGDDVGEESQEREESVLRGEIRTEFELPGELSDAAAEEILTTAIGHIVLGNHHDAISVLYDGFVTPCDRYRPGLEQTGSDRSVACHLHSAND